MTQAMIDEGLAGMVATTETIVAGNPETKEVD